MTDHDDVAQRAYYQPDPDRIQLREDDDSDGGLFRIRMPISSTLEARDGEAFDRERLEGWTTQINEGTVPVYGDHGRNLDLAGSRYSAFGKLGYYDDAEVTEIDDREGEYELVADTVVMDPDSLPEETGSLRENLARLKAQVDRDIPIAQSVGWTDNVGERDVPGGSDLLEGSIVGIPSDGHASSHNSAGVTAAARAAVAAGADPGALVDEFRAVVMGSDARDEDDMTDTDDTDSPDDESGDDSRDDSDGVSAEEFREQMLEMQRSQTETLNTLAEALRQEDDEDEDDEGDEDDDDRDAGEGGDRTVTIDGEEVPAREAVETLRADLEDADPETPVDGDGERDEEADEQSDPKTLLR